MSNVATQHPTYSNNEAVREVIRDLRGGTRAVRAKAQAYLPQFPAELDTTYKARLAMATLLNMYAKTESVMTGLVFQDEIEVEEASPTLEALCENIDNRGNHLNVFAREAFAASFDGAAAILVDAPNVTAPDYETERALGLRPYWVLYKQSDVINWQYRINPVSKSQELTLIVFREVSDELEDDYKVTAVTRYLEYRLIERSVVWRRWREVKKDGKTVDYLVESEGVLERFKEIPVAVLGDLTAPPPLADLAFLNIKHYQKESAFDLHEMQACVNLFYTKGYEGDETLPVASDFHYKLPTDGEIGWAQMDASGNDTIRASLTKLQDDMALLGLAMLADKKAQVDLTATEALLKNIGETAELRVMAEQAKDAFERAFGFTAQYLNEPQTVEVCLGTAWRNDEGEETEADLMMLKLRAEIAVMLMDIWSREKILAFLGAESDDEIETIIKQIQQMDAPMFENQTPPEQMDETIDQ